MKFLQVVIFFIILSCTPNSTAQTVYVTKTGEKFHTSKCHYLKNSKREISLKEALQYGYTPCSVCKPKNTVKNTPNSIVEIPTTQQKVTSTQCTGKTKAGARCKRMTKDPSGRCYQH